MRRIVVLLSLILLFPFFSYSQTMNKTINKTRINNLIEYYLKENIKLEQQNEKLKKIENNLTKVIIYNKKLKKENDMIKNQANIIIDNEKNKFINYKIKNGDSLSKIILRTVMNKKNITKKELNKRIEVLKALNPEIKENNVIKKGKIIKVPLFN